MREYCERTSVRFKFWLLILILVLMMASVGVSTSESASCDAPDLKTAGSVTDKALEAAGSPCDDPDFTYDSELFKMAFDKVLTDQGGLIDRAGRKALLELYQVDYSSLNTFQQTRLAMDLRANPKIRTAINVMLNDFQARRQLENQRQEAIKLMNDPAFQALAAGTKALNSLGVLNLAKLICEEYVKLQKDDGLAKTYLKKPGIPGALDLIFVIDLTSSMEDDILKVQEAAKEIVNTISRDFADFRVAIVGYRDWDDTSMFEDAPFSSNKSKIIENIDKLKVSGGGDTPEAVLEALLRAIDAGTIGGWRDGVEKQIILMGDAPPHSPIPRGPHMGKTAADVANAAEKVDPAVINTILVAGDSGDFDPAAKEAFEELARLTDGTAVTAERAEEVPQKLVQTIEDLPTLTSQPAEVKEGILRTLVYHQITAFDKPISLGQDFQPILSDSGNRAVLRVQGDGPTRAFVVNTDGSGLREVDTGISTPLDISADGSWVISKGGDAGQSLLRIANTDGSGGRDLIAFAHAAIQAAHIAGDGSQVFFNLSRDTTLAGTNTRVERGLYAIHPDGSGLQQIAGPAAISALTDIEAKNVIFYTGAGLFAALDASADGSRIAFIVQNGSFGGAWVFTVHRDGSGLHKIFGPTQWVEGVSISGNGEKIAFRIISDEGVREGYAANFDGSDLRLIATDADGRHLTFSDGNTGSRVPMLTADGSQVIFGTFTHLYNTDGSGVVQLGTPAWTGRLTGAGLWLGTMNDQATRFLFAMRDDNNLLQLATLDLNPSSLGEAPGITDPKIDPPFVLVNGGSTATITAKVTTNNTLVTSASSGAISGAFPVIYDNGLAEDNRVVGTREMFDNGETLGDAVAGDGVYTSDRVDAGRDAPIGPRTVRVMAEVVDEAGLHHATAVEFAPFAVVEEVPPTPTPSPTPSPTPTPTATPPAPTVVPPVAATDTTLLAGRRNVAPDGMVTIPIRLEKADSLGSMNFSLQYDPAVVQVEQVEAGDLIRGALFEANADESGIIRFGVAAKDGVTGDGPVAHVTFTAVGKQGSRSDLTLGDLFATDMAGVSLGLNLQHGQVTIEEKLRGDYDGDGRISARDALAALKMSVGLLSEDLVLDMDADNRVTAEDARRLLQAALGTEG